MKGSRSENRLNNGQVAIFTDDLNAKALAFQRRLSRACEPGPSAPYQSLDEPSDTHMCQVCTQNAKRINSISASLYNDATSSNGSLHKRFPRSSLSTIYSSSPDLERKFRKHITTRDIVDEFFDRTTFHGLYDFYCALSHSWWLSLLWFLILSVATSFFVYEAYQTINQYLTTPLSTNVQLKSVSSLSFPDLTFCNFRKFNNSKLLHLGIGDDVAKHLEHAVFDEFPYIIGKDERNVSETDVYDAGLQMIALEKYQYLDESNDWLRQLYRDLGFDCSEFLRGCKLRSAEFNCCAVAIPELTSLGQCFTIEKKTQRLPGFGNGIRMLINSHIELYPSISHTLLNKGIALIITEPTGAFESQSHGIVFLRAGTHSAVEIRATKLELQETASCLQTEQLPNTPFLYSNTACAANCTAAAILESCGCIPLLPVGFIVANASSPFCLPSQIIHCGYDVLSQKREQLDRCNENCLPKCNRWNYAMTVSDTEFDVEALASAGIDTAERLRNNYVILDIYYNTLEYLVIQDVNTMTWDSMFGVIGGQLSLCLGMSVVTVIQLIFYAIRVAYHRCKKSMRPKREINIRHRTLKTLSHHAIDKLTISSEHTQSSRTSLN